MWGNRGPKGPRYMWGNRGPKGPRYMWGNRGPKGPRYMWETGSRRGFIARALGSTHAVCVARAFWEAHTPYV
jgi:hypothetical protein